MKRWRRQPRGVAGVQSGPTPVVLRQILRSLATGAGTFGTAITVYQTAEPGYSIGQAHNHYLQIAAEGGALLSVPAARGGRGLSVTLFGAAEGRQNVELPDEGWRCGRCGRSDAAKLLGNRVANAGQRDADRGAGGRRDARSGPAAGSLSGRLMLRIGCDLDGVVADFRTAFLDVATNVLGRQAIQRPASPMPDLDARIACRCKARVEGHLRYAKLVAQA